jgi:hypothetical protein
MVLSCQRGHGSERHHGQELLIAVLVMDFAVRPPPVKPLGGNSRHIFVMWSIALIGIGCTTAPVDQPIPLLVEGVIPRIVDAAIADAHRSFREGGKGPLLIDVGSFQHAVAEGLAITIPPDSMAHLIGRPFRATSLNEAFRCESGGVCTIVDDGIFLQMRELRRQADSVVAKVFWSHPYRRAGTPWISCSRTLALTFIAGLSWQLADQQILETC